ncbi:unnamed protein product [Fraxinus pennsylvanica]|uniref:Uncharacterized protein n=1 Tax=Fraxinus pennsylvanica TaxID=56036 RepID=A0AAD1Z7P7_9LAMI|nr:unnamed protein product [Fraxinus pennsylvanica]
MCPAEPFVLSGDFDSMKFLTGKNKSVVLWSIQDHVSTLATDSGQLTDSAGSVVKAADNSSVGPRGVFQGHDDIVEDVQFCPSSSQQFCIVGDDSCLILWDARIGCDPVVKVEKAHSADLHCVDWNSHDENYILTGSDGVGLPVHKFAGHTSAVLCVQWSPGKHSVFGSSAEDGLLNIWDYEKVDEKKESGSKSPSAPPGLIFQHAGHRDKVVDFYWNASDPWTVASVSDDGESSGGGGTLQVSNEKNPNRTPDKKMLRAVPARERGPDKVVMSKPVLQHWQQLLPINTPFLQGGVYLLAAGASPLSTSHFLLGCYDFKANTEYSQSEAELDE